MRTELGEDILDSRDVISKFDDLTETKEELESEVSLAQEELDRLRTKLHRSVNEDEMCELLEEVEEAQEDLDTAQAALEDFLDDSDYKLWEQLVEEGKDSPDWSYGEVLILSTYFVEYTEQFVNDCWELPKEMNSGKWPFNHLTFDWESAAEELNSDYYEIELGGYTYYIRA